jgi:hypothetical protein
MGKNDNRNARKEFLEITKGYNVIAADIAFGDSWTDKEDRMKLKPAYTQEDLKEFLTFLDSEYDSGYGGQELFGVIYCEDGVWMNRGEYDGSEWWNINKYPNLRNSFTEVDVLKYERSKKLKNLNDI